MLSEAAKYKELEELNKLLQSQWEQQMREIEDFHHNKVQQINLYYKKKLDHKQVDVKKLKEEVKKNDHEHQGNLKEIEQDTEKEIIGIQYIFEQKMKEERDSLSGIREENVTMRTKFEKLSKEIEDRKSELNKMLTEERRLQSIIKSLGNDILVVKREMQERDDTIMDKEKRIYDLKKKNQELEKFKFVLDYKIIELKKQVEPRERDIINLSEKIQLMNKELAIYYQDNENLNGVIHNNLLKLHSTQKEVRVEQGRKAEMKTLLGKMEEDLRALSKLPQMSKDVKVCIL